ncbi:MAG: homocysteine S-methyltransferase family protein [Rhodoglobus sp.]
MAKYAGALPQLQSDLYYLTDAGLETDLIFHGNLELPLFASCVLLRTDDGMAALRAYFDGMARIADQAGLGFIVDTATWRANPDWTTQLGYSHDEFREANRAAAKLALDVRDQWERDIPMPVSGVVGPRGDGYRPGDLQSVEEARDYSSRQVGVLAEAGVDFVSAITMNYPAEGAGIALAAQDVGLPVVISFTVETDGNLATGQSLAEAIAFVDEVTGSAPAYYMVNCAHPTHLPTELKSDEPWAKRVRGYRANASILSHTELDEAEDLDAGDIERLAAQLADLAEAVPQLTILGGCCGTDNRHIAAIAAAIS